MEITPVDPNTKTSQLQNSYDANKGSLIEKALFEYKRTKDLAAAYKKEKNL